MLDLVAQSPETDICAEANHRIANHLALVASVLRLQKDAISKSVRVPREHASAVLEECGLRIESIARVHRLLSQRQPHNPCIELGSYLRETAQGILSCVSPSGRFALQFDCPASFDVKPEHAVTVGLLIGELVTNAVKYSHPSGVRGSILVGCYRETDDTTVIKVCDDGVGLPVGFDPKASSGSFGFRLIRSFCKQRGAILEFDSSCLGLEVTIRIPRDD